MSAIWADKTCRGCGVELKHKPGRGRPRNTCSDACAKLVRHYRQIGKPFRGGICADCGEAWWERRWCKCEIALIEKARESGKRRAA